jgi:[acyl-carrier-protein] S-malonyltransferase
MIRPLPLPDRLATTAFAFRGYNVTNLGRTPDLLEHPVYGPVVEDALREGSAVCAAAIGRPCDLVARVRRRQESKGLDTYPEDIALIASVSLAQIRIFEKQFAAPFTRGRLAFGYSLGEASALIAAQMFEMRHLLKIPLALADDSVELARDVTMGVLFARAKALDMPAVQRLCGEVTRECGGTIAVSSVLSPNCVLLLGQNGTVDRFQALAKERLSVAVNVRKNPHRWPPLHTPITWQKAIPNRAAVMLESIPGGNAMPPLPIISGVTGKADFTPDTTRDLIHKWVDHPQLLWHQIVGVLSAKVDTVVHVGPEPNLINATFKRLSDDVRGSLRGRSPGKLGLRMAAGLARRPWLASLLPKKASLLRAPVLTHVNLEDWLLDGAACAVREEELMSA